MMKNKGSDSRNSKMETSIKAVITIASLKGKVSINGQMERYTTESGKMGGSVEMVHGPIQRETSMWESGR
jgi:hypothetical protein